jgi:hypothetical protein
MDHPTSSAAPTDILVSLRIVAIGAVLLLGSIAGGAPAQNAFDNQSGQPAASPPSTQTDTKKTPETTPPAPAGVTDVREAQIAADTQKLLKLSQELKAEVAKSNKDTLSLTVIRKAEEVEKLAKTLKEEMGKSH